jgi:hypothetical protein
MKTKTLYTKKRNIKNKTIKRARRGGNKTQIKIYYNDRPIVCETCQGDLFNEIDISVQRSKTMEFFIGAQNTLADHPLRMYRCIKCSQCKFYYTSTSYNSFPDVIVEKE